MDTLRDQLQDMGLTTTRDRLPEGDADNSLNLESEDIAKWIAEELADRGLSAPFAVGVDVYNSNDLINSLRPGVWTTIPLSAQTDIIGAESSIHRGNLSGGAKQLVCGVETMMRHFYEALMPSGGKKSKWTEMEADLFALNERDVLPTLFFIKGYWKDFRNPTIHGDKEYDSYEAVALWHMSVQAVTRMADVLERRSTLPCKE